jgi:sugar O-acyltransferase (sialic acid O-acetyltransferase NeuD family)
VYIFGAGTLGEMALDVARDLGLNIQGFVDDVSDARECDGVPIGGGTDWLLALMRRESRVAAFVAIGENEGRAEVFRGLVKAGVALPNLVHPRAYIAPSARLGAGNLIMANAYIGTAVRLGDSNVVCPGVCLTHHNKIGDFNFFAPGVLVGGRTVVGDLCKIGMNAVISHDLAVQSKFTCVPSTVIG